MPQALPSTFAEFGSHQAGRLLLMHALLIPAALVLAALALHLSGLDERIAESLFDPALNQFPAHNWPSLELIGHRLAKSAVVVLWILLLAGAVAAFWVQRLARYRMVLWATVLAMAAGPAVVSVLKNVNAIHCPWDLKRFGGTADAATAWFVASSDAGRCFPGGHAAGGFCLAALFFAGTVSGHERLARVSLALALGAGLAFSAVRVIQGAHFVSHNLWSAAIDWAAAALVFAVFAFFVRGRRNASPIAA